MEGRRASWNWIAALLGNESVLPGTDPAGQYQSRPISTFMNRQRISAYALLSLSRPEASRPRAMSTFVALYLSGAALVSVCRIA